MIQFGSTCQVADNLKSCDITAWEQNNNKQAGAEQCQAQALSGYPAGCPRAMKFRVEAYLIKLRRREISPPPQNKMKNNLNSFEILFY